MNRNTLLLTVGGLAVLIIAIISYTSSAPLPHSGSAPALGAAAASTDALAGHLATTQTDERQAPAALGKPDPASQIEPVDPAKYTSAPKPYWEKELAVFVMRLDLSDEAKFNELLKRMNTLPPEGKVLAMEYATALIPDETYAQYRPTLFGFANTPELRETVLRDVLTRTEPVRMPTLVEMLRQPANPEQAEVREILLAYVDVDYGSDVNGWDAAVKKFLAENPDL